MQGTPDLFCLIITYSFLGIVIHINISKIIGPRRFAKMIFFLRQYLEKRVIADSSFVLGLPPDKC